jgi:hypothetical protein
MNYKYLTETVVAKIDSDGISRMSCSVENPEFQSWLAAGNTPLPADPPPPVVITSVTMRQARLALLQAGLLAQVDAAIASMPGVDGEAARIEWEYATEVRRDSPLVDGLAAALSLTPEQLDNLFETGAAL